MKISELNIPAKVKRFYRNRGINKLYPPQAKAIKAGLFSRRNFLIAIPTASGKTLLAELAMLNNGKSLYVVPLRALAREKYAEFKGCEELGLRVGMSIGGLERGDEKLGENDIIITTSEKADILLRSNVDWIKNVSLVVVDELHLLHAERRGAALEVVVTKLLMMGKRIIALSASVGNAEELAEWIHAELIRDDWRPVPLEEKVVRKRSTKLCDEIIAEGGQALVFVSSRRGAEKEAERVGEIVGVGYEELEMIAEQISDMSSSTSEDRLANCVKKGVAFHHAGLSSDILEIIERSFRKSLIKVVTCTPTLAMGVNLPARCVIIRDIKRYNPDLRSMDFIPVLEYKQMVGRAGRPGLDPYGVSYIIAKDYKVDYEDMYVNAEPEPMYSGLLNESNLRMHVLGLIASKFCSTQYEIMDFLKRSLAGFQGFGDEWEVVAVLDFLEQNGLISGLRATRIGRLVSSLYIDPISAIRIIRGIKSIKMKTDLSLLSLIATCTEVEDRYYVRGNERYEIEMFIVEHEDEILQVDEFIRDESVKAARIILDWVNEVDEREITETYGVGAGDLRDGKDRFEWLLHSAARISNMISKDFERPFDVLTRRVRYGVKAELLDLVRISGVGRVYARRIFNGGMMNVKDVASADKEKLANIKGVGPRMADRIINEAKLITL